MNLPWQPDYLERWGRMTFKGGGGGGTTTQTTVQKTEPWAEQKEYLKHGFAGSKDWYDSSTPEYYPDDTVVGFTPAQDAALQLGTQRALWGSPLQQAGMAEAQKTLGGEYLNKGNPYMTDMSNAIERNIRPSIDTRFAGSGRYGSQNHDAIMSREMATALAPYQFNQYNQERQNMQRMAQMAPQMAQADYADLGHLERIGSAQQGQAQTELSSDIAKHNYEQNLEGNKLATYMGLIGGNYGGTQSGTTTQTMPSAGKGGALGTVFKAADLGIKAYTASSRAFKDTIGPAENVLDKIVDMTVDRWEYKYSHPGMPEGEHVGPYADDFAKAFGGNGVNINMVTAFGVCLQAIKELTVEVRDLKAQIEESEK